MQGLKCRATRVEGGWIINGTKKWITNAMWAAYFTVACLDKDSGEIIVLVVERGEGVQTKPIQTSYSSSAAGTAYVTFDNVRVPDSNKLGAGQPGLNIVLSNFNHEVGLTDTQRHSLTDETYLRGVFSNQTRASELRASLDGFWSPTVSQSKE